MFGSERGGVMIGAGRSFPWVASECIEKLASDGTILRFGGSNSAPYTCRAGGAESGPAE